MIDSFRFLKISIFFSLIALSAVTSCKQNKTSVLVFSKTAGFRHESIADGKLALIALGEELQYQVDTTEDASWFNEANLKRYKAVVFLNTTLDVLNPVQQTDFKRFIEAGGGFVGIHAAADTEYEWPWYGKLVGAYFNGHPPGTAGAKLKKVNAFGDNSLPDEWSTVDEWYNYKSINPDINVIYNLDESTYEGGTNGSNHPIAWYHEFEGGRSFYTGLGHTKESFQHETFLSLLTRGIRYAVGNGQLDYNKVKSPRMPEENRFSKVVLDFNLDEPTEMAVLPNGNILFLERKGKVKLYNKTTKRTAVIAEIPVSTKYNPDEKGEQREAEDGLLGLALDPDFEYNHWVYLFYSPAGDDPKNILTRYTLRGDRLDLASKKVMLEVPVQRNNCCHTGGSIAFDAEGNLYVSTGDNTSPWSSDGYGPTDERPGQVSFDAQKSSSNTNDLRGKILRIRPQRDGTYTIPEGNLFPKGEPGTRPEIYVMGVRNPYRISVDKRTGYLYWGDVGPDAGSANPKRGPHSFDEFNQAKRAGNFGWPYFIGNNYPYALYDFATHTAGAFADPQKPINESVNNTGKRELPALSPAFIWYPYIKSEEFPMFKEGGRTAMVGPFYYSKDYQGIRTAFPKYFDGKLLIYEWMRNWMFMVSMDEHGAIMDIEPFMPNTTFNNIMDIDYGPDGKMYMLEYGTAWFKQNFDARLVRIDYNGGNRPPVALLTADKSNGAIPLTVEFDYTGTYDPDGDALTARLSVAGRTYLPGNGKFIVTIDEPGVYTPELRVKDGSGGIATARLKIIAGNSSPEISINIVNGNQAFFFPDIPVHYTVEVNDKEDGSTKTKSIHADSVKITFDYVQGYDMVHVAQGHQKAMAEPAGKILIDNSDCKSCHILNQKSAGPSYSQIASKYQDEKDAVNKLAAKVIKGGSGVWGDTEMAAHPQISIGDARKMIEYILGLAKKNTLPLAGSVIPEKQTEGAYLITASYQDRGNKNTSAISVAKSYALRYPFLSARQASDVQGSLDNVKHNTSASFKNVDLTGVKTIKADLIIGEGQLSGTIELRLDKPDGLLIGTLTGAIPAQVHPVTGIHTLYVVFKNKKAGDEEIFKFTGLSLSNR